MVQRYLKVSKSCSVPTSPRAYIFTDSNQRLQNMPRIQGNFQTCQACQEDCHTCQATGHKHGRNDYTSSDMNLTTAHRVWLKQIDQPKSDTATSPNTAPATQSVTDKVRWKHVKRPLHCATDPRRSETVLNMIRDQTRHRQPLTFNTSGSWNWDFFPLLCLSVTLFFLIRLGSFPTQLPFDHWLHGLQLFSKFVSSHQGIWSLAPVFDFAMPRFGELLPKNVEMALKPSALRVHWTEQMLRKGVPVLRCLFWCWVLMASLFTLSAPWQSTGDGNIFQKCFCTNPSICPYQPIQGLHNGPDRSCIGRCGMPGMPCLDWRSTFAGFCRAGAPRIKASKMYSI